MNEAQQQAFYSASGFHANQLNFDLRLFAGLLLVVVSIFIIVGLIKLLEHGLEDHLKILLHLIGLSIVVMVFFTFVT